MGTSDANDIHDNVLIGGRQGIVVGNSDDNTISANVVSMTHDFFGISVGGSGNLVDDNHVFRSGANFWIVGTGNVISDNVGSEGAHGFSVVGAATDNTLTGNKATSNSTGFGFYDETTGSGTSGTANTYSANSCSSNATTSTPPGLC